MCPSEINSIKNEKKAQYIKERYDYMDKLPLEGWIWEFIRRGEEYEGLYKECLVKSKKLRAGEKHNFVFTWERAFYEIGLNVFFYEGNCSKNEYSIISFKDSHEFAGSPYMALPNHNKNYDEFTSVKPSIIGARSVVSLDYPSIREWLTDEEDEEDGSLERGAVDRLLQMLSPGRFEKTLYFGVSMVSSQKEILEQISDAMGKYCVSRTGLNKKKSKLRDDRWRHYLIVYDLNLNEKTYDEIADLLQKAYPKKPRKNEAEEDTDYDARNIEDYWKKARELINMKDYKKYLAI